MGLNSLAFHSLPCAQAQWSLAGRGGAQAVIQVLTVGSQPGLLKWLTEVDQNLMASVHVMTMEPLVRVNSVSL